jgi:hypothetical protein
MPRTVPSSLRRARALALIVVTTVALLSATVAIGQASLAYDLACRSVISGGGGIVSGGVYGLHGTLGVPIAPPKEAELAPTYAVRSADFGLRAGFLPGYSNALSVSKAGVSEASASPDQAFVQRLPWVTKFGRIVRGGC